jgi:hypothetical protein
MRCIKDNQKNAEGAMGQGQLASACEWHSHQLENGKEKEKRQWELTEEIQTKTRAQMEELRKFYEARLFEQVMRYREARD